MRRNGAEHAMNIDICRFSLVAAFSGLFAIPAGAGHASIAWSPETLALTDGRSVSVERGTIAVAEDRTKPAGRRIDLALLRMKSRAAEPGPPIVYLEGGPGGSAVGIARVPEYFAAFDRLRDVADVILIDQRGAGLSNRLSCAADRALAGTVFLTPEAMLAALKPPFERCLEQLRAKGVDLANYNTNTIADDLDEVRQALGVDRISIVGFSYGTHLGLAYIRRYDRHLHRAALVAVEGPDHTIKLPSWMDVHLANVARVAGRPELVEKLKAVLDRFENAPVTYELTHPRTGAVARVEVGRTGVEYIIRRDIGDTNDLPRLPALIDALFAGQTQALKPLVERRYGALASGVFLMPFAVNCASGASQTRRAQATLEAKSAILGENVLDDAACGAMRVPDLGDAFRLRVHSGVPTLFVSGTLDAHTPPFQAEEIRWGFPFSTHLVVERAGHESLLPHPEVQAAIADFLAGRDVAGRRIVYPLRFDVR
jgi:pimeloyl-ACP methyl ester carboxylesterase